MILRSVANDLVFCFRRWLGAALGGKLALLRVELGQTLHAGRRRRLERSAGHVGLKLLDALDCDFGVRAVLHRVQQSTAQQLIELGLADVQDMLRFELRHRSP